MDLEAKRREYLKERIGYAIDRIKEGDSGRALDALEWAIDMDNLPDDCLGWRLEKEPTWIDKR